MNRTLLFLAVSSLAVLACAPAQKPVPSGDEQMLDTFRQAARCLDQARALHVSGRMKLRITFVETGAITEVVVIENELGPELAECVTDALAKGSVSERPSAPRTIPVVFSLPK
jgi:hypothetical protein